jgi:hypothetical protein
MSYKMDQVEADLKKVFKQRIIVNISDMLSDISVHFRLNYVRKYILKICAIFSESMIIVFWNTFHTTYCHDSDM